ncbi:hypothetical protein K469DRAFT_752354 [Zopfia rhizophila CBS 207.26]|uniref:Uncharacterized protein n=1 Tax=Zopfia rhizophila CBS 207.26 TaxID=1314779 RepID=A0A6A6DRR5_9PEZI|nr:hypothetical protein K469DRAFT_752354 [Zopfia rhizophila CBS 207.26]
MSLLDTDGKTTLLRDCISNKRKAYNLIESLGLIVKNTGKRIPTFDDPDVANLYKDISLEVSKLAEKQADLKKEEILDDVLDRLLTAFGEKIWGRRKRSHLLKAGNAANPLYPKNLYFDSTEDREAIRFYLRCWIVARAARSMANEQRKLKEMYSSADPQITKTGRQAKIHDPSPSPTTVLPQCETFEGRPSTPGRDISDKVNNQEAPSGPGSPRPTTSFISERRETGSTFRAPTAPMYRRAPSQADSVLGSVSQLPTLEINPSHARDFDEDIDAGHEGEPSERSPNVDESPESNKRKRRDSVHQTKPGKLKKTRISPPVPDKMAQNDPQDPYSLSHLRSNSSTAHPFRTTFEPSTDEEEENEISESPLPECINRIGQEEENIDQAYFAVLEQIKSDISAMGDSHSQQEENNERPTKSPFRPHGLSPSRARGLGVHIDLSKLRRENEATESDPRSATVDCRPFGPFKANQNISPANNSTQQTRLRGELFKLILSRLSNLNQFSPGLDHQQPEERLNHLLGHFWTADWEIMQQKFGDRFETLESAFFMWKEMRSNLHSFQLSTKYFGGPGEEWKAHLRSISSIAERAQACIAINDLSCSVDRIQKIGDQFQGEAFNEDLMVVFDELTNVSSCNGTEEFRGVYAYNERLLAWFTSF